MSKTYRGVYGPGYRFGRKLRWWEKLMIFARGKKARVEDRIIDDNSGDADFLILLFASLALAAAGIAVWAAAGLA